MREIPALDEVKLSLYTTYMHSDLKLHIYMYILIYMDVKGPLQLGLKPGTWNNLDLLPGNASLLPPLSHPQAICRVACPPYLLASPFPYGKSSFFPFLFAFPFPFVKFVCFPSLVKSGWFIQVYWKLWLFVMPNPVGNLTLLGQYLRYHNCLTRLQDTQNNLI